MIRLKLALRYSVPPVSEVRIPACPIETVVGKSVKLNERFQDGEFASWLYLPIVRFPAATWLISPDNVVSALATLGPLPRPSLFAESV